MTLFGIESKPGLVSRSPKKADQTTKAKDNLLAEAVRIVDAAWNKGVAVPVLA